MYVDAFFCGVEDIYVCACASVGGIHCMYVHYLQYMNTCSGRFSLKNCLFCLIIIKFICNQMQNENYTKYNIPVKME